MDYKKEAEELRAKADLMDWVADGGEVENCYGDEWHDMKESHFIWESKNYRKKVKPEYIPFDDTDRDFLRGKWIKFRYEEREFVIDFFSTGICNGYDYDYIFENATFLDGSPFGKIKK